MTEPLIRHPLPDQHTGSCLVDGDAPNGEPIISVVFGMTFAIDKAGKLQAKGDYQIVDDWIYEKARVATRFTKPSLLTRDADVYAWRNLTDVVVRGSAYAQKPTKSMEVRLEVRGGKVSIDRALSVTGDRWVEARRGAPKLSDPEPFTDMPLRYDRAYGGTDEAAEEKYADKELLNYFVKQIEPAENEELSEFSYPRNPAGRGYLVDEGGLHGLPWPNIEFAEDRLRLESVVQPLERWGERPYPAGFDWFAHAWFPRCAFAVDFPETHDERVPEAERRLGLFEQGFEQKAIIDRPKHGFANGAHPYLARHRLAGDETIRIQGMSPDGSEIKTKLPGLSPRVSLKFVGDSVVVLPAAVDLVLVEAEQREVTMLWRATHMHKKEHLPLYWIEQTEYSIAW